MNKLLLALVLVAPLAIPTVSAQAAVHDGVTKSSVTVVSREPGEGPRGGDNERPGDRQRRGK